MNALHTFVASTFLGLPLVAWGGVTTLALLTLQMMVGLRWIKIDFKYHTYLGWTLFGVALVHATAALIFIFG